MSKLIILDRDGVINEDSDAYIKSIDEWHPIPGSLEAMARLSKAGWRVFIATNQAGIGRGLLSHEDLTAMHDHLRQRLAALGGAVEDILFAPEHPDQATEMRKPNPGMLLEIGRRCQQSLENVSFVGDSISDVDAARAAGARPILVRTGKGRRTEKEHALADVPIYDSLEAYVSALLAAQA